jgi:signal transduction histidine kinase
MFWPKWPSSGVQAVMVKDSAAHFNMAFSSYFIFLWLFWFYVGYHQFNFGILQLHVVALDLFGLLVVAALNVLAGAGILLCVCQPPVIHYTLYCM